MRRSCYPHAINGSISGMSGIVLVLFVFSVISVVPAMAVDRTKFRTCGQTSFCRRHRGGHSASLYQYKLDRNSIRFVPPTTTTTTTTTASEGDNAGAGGIPQESSLEGDAKVDTGLTGALWNSLKRMVSRTKLYSSSSSLLSSSSSSSPNKLDPYMRGPEATLMGTLINTAPETSTGQPEQLSLSVHLHDDGTARVRVTEAYGNPGTIYEKARWTSDELILNMHEMMMGASVGVQMLNWSSENRENEELFYKLMKHVRMSNGKEDGNKENFIGLKYGSTGNNNEFLLLLRLDSFAFYLWRDGEYDKDPILTAGTGGLMHFEIRRPKVEEKAEEETSDELQEEGESENVPSEGQSDETPTEKDEAQKKNKKKKDDPDRHGGKEIVGYWEDGLAIYADGTREEREVEDEEEARHRQLLEEQAPELDKEGMWDECFHSHCDSKPHGPTSVGMDIVFPKSKHLFGLPEHASSTLLKATHGEGAHYHDPYRMYNLDVFEYELDETMALYGNVPLVVSHSLEGGTVGVFWFNPTETFVDVENEKDDPNLTDGTKTHWMSESGVIDIFLLPGPDPAALYEQYAHLTGRMPLPPMFSLGYHQCRWNYKDERDVYHVHGKFEELDYPYDVLWLDIEHTNGKRYFTWDSNLFPHPKEMQEKLWSTGRRMVTIIDPHIKRDDNYYIHKDATAKGLYVKDKTGKNDYDGWCWPGSSSYLDFTADRVRSWWADQFSYKRYEGSTPSLFTWNDMNEPSVFNGPEVSMQKDLLNLDGVEHREWHNIYGLLFHRATGEGLIRRNGPEENVRPFVLSRAFFAGSQRYGAIWTGDNLAEWSHLQVSSPMLLSLNVAALSFVGADVGGFFGNPDAELMTRWMQAGAYQPFFRGHAHHDAKRREPWMFGDETMFRLRKAAMARYALLPFWYTVFREAGLTGMPVMRTMWMQYPKTRSLFEIDDQYLIGSDLLVKPVTAAGVTQTTVLFPTADLWYDVDTMQAIPVSGKDDDARSITVESDIDKIPVYQRGGSVITRKLRLRRSSHLMRKDPYTLYIALDNSKKASGWLYMDDEETFDHERKGDYGVATFAADWNLEDSWIRNKALLGAGWEGKEEAVKGDRMVERIIVMGVENPPKNIVLAGASLEFEHDAVSKVLVIRKPGVSALETWEMEVVQN